MNSETIIPAYSSLYEWEFEQDDERAYIKFKCPNNFDPNLLQFEFSEDNTAVAVTIEGVLIPVLKGIIYKPITEYEISRSSQKVILYLIKVENEEWLFPVCGPYPDSNDIDPKSAFLLSQSNIEPKESHQFLNISASYHFLPALRYLISQLEENPNQNDLIKNTIISLYRIAIDDYDDPLSSFNYAKYLINQGFENKFIFDILQFASESSIPNVVTLQAQLLSKFSGIPFECKRDQLAVQFLQKAIEENENDSVALHLIAMHYCFGCGVKKDIKLAEKYQEMALKINPDVEPLKDQKQGVNKLIIVSAIAITAVVGFTIFKHFKKKS
ncbi:hypothetical protein GPJ56_002779 [Histomonas meleagridis]|uniref:uncharacterized protein n=1 Tax=Histomonas meleagridis TaxID=135588 RepID=UPI0035595278|nr:hypothetical protein GPJ56_002779 [Histomonas meleagridis]KAH0800086.1 hypothetical protein GO595_007198 [Histomonas meleagridis]